MRAGALSSVGSCCILTIFGTLPARPLSYDASIVARRSASVDFRISKVNIDQFFHAASVSPVILQACFDKIIKILTHISMLIGVPLHRAAAIYSAGGKTVVWRSNSTKDACTVQFVAASGRRSLDHCARAYS